MCVQPLEILEFLDLCLVSVDLKVWILNAIGVQGSNHLIGVFEESLTRKRRVLQLSGRGVNEGNG